VFCIPIIFDCYSKVEMCVEIHQHVSGTRGKVVVFVILLNALIGCLNYVLCEVHLLYYVIDYALKQNLEL